MIPRYRAKKIDPISTQRIIIPSEKYEIKIESKMKRINTINKQYTHDELILMNLIKKLKDKQC